MKYQIIYTTRTGQKVSAKASSISEAIAKAMDFNKRYGCLCFVYEYAHDGMKQVARVNLDGSVERSKQWKMA